MSKPLADIIRILAAGGGVSLDSAMPTPDLIRIAANAGPETTIIVRNAALKPTDDLVKISESARGCVLFEL
jgi:hypothetical protein